MAPSDIGIIWPAPGFPAFLERHDLHLEILVASRVSSAEAVRSWVGQVALRDRLDGALIPFKVEALEPAPSAVLSERAGDYAALPQASGCAFFQARLAIPRLRGAAPPRSARVFDLVNDGEVVRSRSVALICQSHAVLNLAFASDLHVALIWDELAGAVERHAPEFAGTFVNPHRLLDRFIDEANRLAADGSLDLVVLGGDLVDHVHAGRRGSAATGSRAWNVTRLLAALDRLDVPTFTVPGNHDYRAFPWRPRFWGLGASGLSWRQTQTLLRRSGLWDYWPISARDIDSLRATDLAGRPALADYLTRVSPVTDHCCSLRGIRLLFASTGRDIVGRWHEVERRRRWLFLRGLPATAVPNSEGFSDTQFARIRGWLRDAGSSAVFFHAPLLAPRTAAPAEAALGCIDPGPQDSLPARVRFERRLQQAGLRCGVSFRNPGPLLRELAAAPGFVSTFSGHVHRAGAIAVDRRTMLARSVPPNDVAATPDALRLYTAPALAQLRPGVTGGPGYFRVRFESGAPAVVAQRQWETP